METGLLLELAGKSLLVGLLAILLLRAATSRSAAARAATAHAGLLALLVLPVLMTVLPRWSAPLWPAAWLAPAVVPADAPLTPFELPPTQVSTPVASTPHAEPVRAPTVVPSPRALATPAARWNLQPAAWALYLVPAGLLLLALLLATRRLAALSRRAQGVERADWRRALARVQRRFGWSHPVALKSTAELDAPISCGWLQPTVLLDAPTLARDTTSTDAEALLAHELAHIARRDWLQLLLARTVTAVHWFNPLAWWLAAQAHQLREEAADDAVLRRGVLDGGDYAQLLVRAARLKRTPGRLPLAHGMAAGGLKARIQRILDPQLDRRPARRTWSIACAVLALGVAAPLAALVPAVELNPMTPTRAVLKPAVEREALAPARGALATTVELNARMPSLAVLDTPIDMPHLAVSLASGSLAATAPDGPWVITWTAHPIAARTSDGAARVQLGLSYAGAGQHHYNSSSDVLLADLRGLDLQQMAADTAQPVGFTLEREAGTLQCRGDGRQGSGAGRCDFSASSSYLATLDRHGLAQPDLAQQLQLALSDVRLAVLDELKGQKYDEIDIDRLVEAGIHGVRTEWLQDLAAAGYHAGSVARLVEFRIHGVDANFIRGMAAVSPQYGTLDPAELVEFRIHGVSPDMVRELAAAGYSDLRQRDLVSMAIHRATPRYIHALAALGYRGIGAEQLVEMRIHGVDPEWIAELAALGYRDLRPAKMVEMRIHGISPQWIAELATLGYRDIPPSKLVEMRIHGVDADFIRARQQERREGRHLTVDRLVTMKIMGD